MKRFYFIAENRKYSLEYKQFLTSLKDIQQETKKLEDIFGFTTNFIELKDNADVINIEIKVHILIFFLNIYTTFIHIFLNLISLQFSDTKIVLFSYEKRAKLFALADMQPLHPNFSELQQFLFQSQDTAGFMASVNDYFAMFT